MSPRRLALACLIPLSWLVACDQQPPVAPILEAGVSGAGGATVGAPSNVNASALSDSRIDVSWQDNSSNESGFEVHRSTTGLSGVFSIVASTGPNVTRYGNTGLTASTQYCYKVRASRTTGSKTSYSAFSNSACTTTPLPAAPSNTAARPLSSSEVEVTWTDNTSVESGFRVERSVDHGSTWTAVTTSGPNATRTSDQGRSAESPELCYHVITVTESGESVPSTVDCTTPPAPPSNLAAAGSGSAVNLTWNDASSIEDGFMIDRAVAGSGFSTVAALAANATSYQDAPLPEGTYWYVVRATKDGGQSDPSNAVQVVVTSAPPSEPVSVVARPSSSTVVEIGWFDPSTNEEGFRIERSIDGAVSWVMAGTVGADAGVFDDGGRASEEAVCYRVIAFNSVGESPPSPAACTIPPLGPTDLTAAVVDSVTLDFAWTDNSAVEDGYEIFAENCYVDCSYVFSLGVAAANATSLRVRFSNPWAWTFFQFYVQATRDGGHSDKSNYAYAYP
jgi:titin